MKIASIIDALNLYNSSSAQPLQPMWVHTDQRTSRDTTDAYSYLGASWVSRFSLSDGAYQIGVDRFWRPAAGADCLRAPMSDLETQYGAPNQHYAWDERPRWYTKDVHHPACFLSTHPSRATQPARMLGRPCW